MELPHALPSPSVARPPVAKPALSAAAASAKKTAEEFEAVFLGQMTQMMMQSVQMGEEFSGGHGEEMFRGILAETMGTAIAKRGGVGLAPAVMAHIITLQGGQDNGQ